MWYVKKTEEKGKFKNIYIYMPSCNLNEKEVSKNCKSYENNNIIFAESPLACIYCGYLSLSLFFYLKNKTFFCLNNFHIIFQMFSSRLRLRFSPCDSQCNVTWILFIKKLFLIYSFNMWLSLHIKCISHVII